MLLVSIIFVRTFYVSIQTFHVKFLLTNYKAPTFSMCFTVTRKHVVRVTDKFHLPTFNVSRPIFHDTQYIFAVKHSANAQ